MKNNDKKQKLAEIGYEDDNGIYYIFEGSPYFALDNFYPLEHGVGFEGMRYRNSEAAFQAAKLKNKHARLPFMELDANESKWRGKNPNLTPLRSDWNEVKDEVMYTIVKNKMERHPKILALLISTGNKDIKEGNFWNDLYWGVDYQTRKGRNQLGITLMRLREEFKQ